MKFYTVFTLGDWIAIISVLLAIILSIVFVGYCAIKIKIKEFKDKKAKNKNKLKGE